MCVSVSVCVHAHAYMHMCAHLCVEAVYQAQVLVLRTPSTLVLEAGSLTNLELADSSRLAGHGAAGSTCLCFPNSKVVNKCVLHVCGFWG